MAADGVLDVAAIAGSEVDVLRAIGRVMVAVGTETGTEPEAEPVMKTGQMAPNGGALTPSKQPRVLVELEPSYRSKERRYILRRRRATGGARFKTVSVAIAGRKSAAAA